MPKSLLSDTWLRRSTPQANPLRAQSAWNLSAPSGGALKLGFGLQLVTVRWTGAFLEDPADVPAVVLDFVARAARGRRPVVCEEAHRADRLTRSYRDSVSMSWAADSPAKARSRRMTARRARRPQLRHRSWRSRAPREGHPRRHGGEQGAPDIESPGTRRARSRVLDRCPEGYVRVLAALRVVRRRGGAAARRPGWSARLRSRIAPRSRPTGSVHARWSACCPTGRRRHWPAGRARTL